MSETHGLFPNWRDYCMKTSMIRICLILCLLLVTACGAGASDISPKIVVDQFGYLPSLEKRAVIRNPQIGYDKSDNFQPGSTYAVIDTRTGRAVYEGAPTVWGGGKTDPVSGDKVWWFDFSAVTQEGTYVIRDVQRGVDSYPFDIRKDVYTPVLKAAFKTFYLQRAGFEKLAPFAPRGFADGASHIGAGQDGEATLFSAKSDKRTARDLRGGWYDAGDYNEYTSWTANYIVTLLQAYDDNRGVWTDDFGIPESGNGVPDILDEVKWGLDWLSRMQNPNGSMLSVMSLSEATPPSAATGPSHYGPENTSATYTSAAAFAMAAKIYGENPRMRQQASSYATRAKRAWAWASANPNVTFKNNDAEYGSEGLAAGQQEVDDEGRQKKRLMAAALLFAMSGEQQYANAAERAYQRTKPIDPYYANGFEAELTFTLLYLAKQPRLRRGFRNRILSDYRGHIMQADNGWASIADNRDPYSAHIQDYTWGSNSVKSRKGSLYIHAITAGLKDKTSTEYLNAASHYLHYLHGVNPLGKVYLSNMGYYGAENSVTRFYHAWFKGDITPAAGFLVGGPNPYYSRDACCDTRCGGEGARMCNLPKRMPPLGQPHGKSYTDFNDGWPINSWEVTENSNGYQVAYLRLLSKFAG